MDECNADVDHACDAGNNGEPCVSCATDIAHAMRMYRHAYHDLPAAEYNAQLRDAGRGHLVR